MHKIFPMRSILVFLGLVAHISLFAQFTPAPALVPGVNMEVKFDMDKGIFYSHTIKANQTLYSISKFFGIDVNEIKLMNNLTSNSVVSIGQKLMIPLDVHHINVHDDGDGNNPVYYQVQKGENLYRIAKVYFNQEVETLVARNALSEVSLSVGDLLIVGYYQNETPFTELPQIPKTGTPSTTIKEDVARSKTKANSAVDESTGEPKPEVKRVSRKGIAIWNKEGKDQKNAFALHKTAKPNTIIELYNPVVRRRAYAKVIGALPEDVYEEDVTLIISPKVAKSLGALDSRFTVEMKYQEK